MIFCGMYVTNAWNAAQFPFLSQDLFYANGSQYDQNTILNADWSLNETALEEQGLPSYAASNAIYYLGCNLAIGATLTHVGIWYVSAPLSRYSAFSSDTSSARHDRYWRPIMQAFKAYRDRSQPDPHYQMMRVYKEVPVSRLLPGAWT